MPDKRFSEQPDGRTIIRKVDKDGKISKISGPVPASEKPS